LQFGVFILLDFLNVYGYESKLKVGFNQNLVEFAGFRG
jgi:hypothetical protein